MTTPDGADNLEAARLLEKEAQLLTRELLIVDDQGADGAHDQAVARSGAVSSGISMRASVPCPGTLCRCSL